MRQQHRQQLMEDMKDADAASSASMLAVIVTRKTLHEWSSKNYLVHFVNLSRHRPSCSSRTSLCSGRSYTSRRDDNDPVMVAH